jgi:hypothetical protein
VYNPATTAVTLTNDFSLGCLVSDAFTMPFAVPDSPKVGRHGYGITPEFVGIAN